MVRQRSPVQSRAVAQKALINLAFRVIDPQKKLCPRPLPEKRWSSIQGKYFKTMNISFTVEEFCHHQTYILRYAPKTILRYKNHLGLLQRFLREQHYSGITEKSVKSFFIFGSVQRQWSPATFINYHKTLHVFFRWCVKEHYLEKDFTEEIQCPKLKKSLPKSLSKQGAMKLLDISYNLPYPYKFLRYRNRAIIAMFIYTGLRKSELLNLKLSEVDLENRTLFIYQGKGGKDRIIPLSFKLIHFLEEYLRERKRLKKSCPEFFTSLNKNMGFTPHGMKHLRNKLQDKSKITFTWHALRHTFATLMLEGGCDIYSLSKMMGHSDIKTTTIYLSATPEHLRSEIEKHPLDWRS